jgi:hypothetical protein
MVCGHCLPYWRDRTEDGEILTITCNAAEKVILRDNDLSESRKLKAELDYYFQTLMNGDVLT